jgi:hypothetical protein
VGLIIHGILRRRTDAKDGKVHEAGENYDPEPLGEHADILAKVKGRQHDWRPLDLRKCPGGGETFTGSD